MTLVELKMQSELEIGHTSGVLKVLIRSNSSNCVHNSSPNSFGFIRATRWINSLMRHHVQHVCMFWLRQRVLWRLLRQLGWGSQAVSALMTHFKNCGLPLPQDFPSVGVNHRKVSGRCAQDNGFGHLFLGHFEDLSFHTRPIWGPLDRTFPQERFDTFEIKSKWTLFNL